MPKLLELLDIENVSATFFVTGRTAELFPDCIAAVVARGHEIGCHGYWHTSFRKLSSAQVWEEIARANRLLRAHAPVTSFRAPYLTFNESHVPILAEAGFTVDSSRALYKRNQPPAVCSGLIRLNASVTSSVLRLPSVLRDPWFACLEDPVTLFVHPWEFVDLTKTNLRVDCRFRTGEPAMHSLRSTIEWFRSRDFVFQQARDFAPRGAAP